FDHAALTRRVTSFEKYDDFLSVLDDPLLELDQLGLELAEVGHVPVSRLAHLLQDLCGTSWTLANQGPREVFPLVFGFTFECIDELLLQVADGLEVDFQTVLFGELLEKAPVSIGIDHGCVLDEVYGAEVTAEGSVPGCAPASE